MNARSLLAVLPAVTALALLQGCKQAPPAEAAPARYLATRPVAIDTSYEKQYVAEIRSVRNIEIRAQEKGFLDQIPVDEGHTVSAGQLLFRIMPREFEAEVQKADAEVRTAEIELQNTTALAAKNIVSKNEQATAQAKLDKAKAELAQARLHLSFTEMRAPFAGVLDRIPKKLGTLVEEGELLTTLSDNSRVYAYFNLSEPEYLAYSRNASASRTKPTVALVLADNSRFPHQGSVETVEGEFDHETGNIAFRATFPNPDRLLKNGETGKVLLTVPYTNALMIPQKATFELQDRTYVFVIDAQHKVHSRLITVIGRLPDLFIVGSELSASDQILLEGVQKVKDDDVVQFDVKEPREVIAKLRLKAE